MFENIDHRSHRELIVISVRCALALKKSREFPSVSPIFLKTFSQSAISSDFLTREAACTHTAAAGPSIIVVETVLIGSKVLQTALEISQTPWVTGSESHVSTQLKKLLSVPALIAANGDIIIEYADKTLHITLVIFEGADKSTWRISGVFLKIIYPIKY